MVDPASQITFPTARWISRYPDFEQTAFFDALKGLSEVFTELPVVERRYNFLDVFEGVRHQLLRGLKGKEIGADVFYRELVSQYGAIASYASIYDRLIDNGFIDRSQVRSLLDLGPGYWNSSLVYSRLFPSLSTAIGIEIDTEKVEAAMSDTLPIFGISPDRFRMVQGNFIEMLRNSGSLLPPVELPAFELIVMQTFYPYVPRDNNLYGYHSRDRHNLDDYRGLFEGVVKLLSDKGALIVSLDGQDFPHSERIREVAQLLLNMGATPISDVRVARAEPFRIDKELEVRIFVLGRGTQSRTAG